MWVPWDIGGMYYQLSLLAHAGLLRDVLNRLLPKRQITTNAHPLVEMVLMKQGNRTLLHLVNLSGHSQTGYFAPVPMSDIRVEVAGAFRKATAVRTPAVLPVRGSSVTLPRLADYELIVLE